MVCVPSLLSLPLSSSSRRMVWTNFYCCRCLWAIFFSLSLTCSVLFCFYWHINHGLLCFFRLFFVFGYVSIRLQYDFWWFVQNEYKLPGLFAQAEVVRVNVWAIFLLFNLSESTSTYMKMCCLLLRLHKFGRFFTPNAFTSWKCQEMCLVFSSFFLCFIHWLH